VLNAVPLDKRIHANAMLGTFKVRQVIDLTGSMERVGLSLLMYKVGDYRDTPAAVSFDASVLTNSRGQDSNGTPEWSQIGDAALTSLDPLVVLEDVNGDSDHDWCMLAAGQCAASGMDTPQIQVSRPMGGAEVKLQQWMRLKPSCLLHCAAEEVDVAHWLREGAAVLRRNGGVALPTPANEAREGLPGVVVLDRCNLERAERKQWVQLGGLRFNEVGRCIWMFQKQSAFRVSGAVGCTTRLSRLPPHLRLQLQCSYMLKEWSLPQNVRVSEQSCG